MHQNNEFASTLRIGKVTEFDPEKHAARVNFPDISGKISDWLPLMIPTCIKNKHEYYVDPGDHVICLMSGQGDEFGVILGTFYDDKNKPPKKQGDLHRVEYSDGTVIQYDRKEHRLFIHCVKDISIEAGSEITINAGSHIGLTAPRIDLN